MTTDTPTDTPTDAEARHRELRRQFKEWERSVAYDGHGRHAGSAKAKAAQRIRCQRRRSAERVRQWTAQRA